MRRLVAALALVYAATAVPVSGEDEMVVNGVIVQSDPTGTYLVLNNGLELFVPPGLPLVVRTG